VFCLLISSLLAVGGQPGKANPAVKAEDVKSSTSVVVMLGDSTTECSGNKPGERLTDLVQTYLTKEQILASVVNSGIGSATAKIGLSRLKDQVLVHDPALVTISFGLNDTGRSNPEEYRQCLEKMVQSIQTNTHAKILLVTSTPFINERHQWRGQFTAKGGIDAALDTKFCSVMRLLAKENNLPLCDLHAHFTAQFEKNPKLRDELILPDGVHLTDKGNEVAAQYLAPAVATLLAKSANRETADNQKFPVGIPYPEALDKAAVHQTKISDLNREGLLVGNGDLNGLLYERDGTLCLRISKNDVWDARVDTSEDPPMLKVNVPEHKWTNGGGLNQSYNRPFPSPRTAAIVLIRTNAGPSTLDLKRAVALTGGISVRALADRNVFLINAGSEVSIEEIKARHLPAAELGETGGVKWLHMKMPGDTDYAGMEFAVAVAGGGGEMAVALLTSRDTKANVRDAAIELARTTVSEEAGKLVARHEAEWAKFWAASGVALDDAELQAWWYRMVYLLRCVSKPGAVPVGLFVGSSADAPPWHGDYHHNYNAWQPHWTAFPINHPELAEPWVRYMNEMLPRLKWLAKTSFDCEGAYVGIASFPFEPDPANCKMKNNRQYAHMPYNGTLGMMGMSAQVLWYNQLYQPDRQHLEEKIYPVIRETALFYCSFAEKCPRDSSGRAKFGPSYSPEHGTFGVDNTPFDLAYARYSMKAAMAAADELGRDPELVTRFRKALDLLPDYPTAPDAEGKPVVVDWTGCRFREIKEHNLTVPVVPVFPGDQVTCFSPEAEKELFRHTISQTRHRGLNSTIMMSVAKARFSMPGACDDLRNYYKPLAQPNGLFFVPDCGFYLVESVGISAAISEFLLQSVDNTIRVFPAWPKTKDASFTNLRAQGGFLVSAEQKDGQIVKLEITATVGGKLRVLNPWTGNLDERDLAAGKTLRMNP